VPTYLLTPINWRQVAPSRAIRVQKRVNLSLPVDRLKAIGQRLYVQLSGRKVPLYLDYDADLVDVQERALALLRFRHEHGNDFDTEGWRDALGQKRARTGKGLGPAKGSPTSISAGSVLAQ
jgi:hypothetical protein